MSSNTPSVRPRIPRTFRSLRHRDYRLYFLGQLVSLTGSWMQTAALMWLAYDLTGLTRWPAFGMIAQLLPTVLLAPLAGVLADRWPKRRLIFRTQLAFLVTALVLTTVTALGLNHAWPLLLFMGVHGVIQAFDLPARLAFVSELVPRDDLVNAVALNSLLFNTARLVGPALAGVVLVELGRFGPPACFLGNALSYVAVLCALRGISAEGHPHPGEEGRRRSLWSGFGYLREDPRMGALVVLAGAVGLCGWPLLTLLPAFAGKVLRLGEAAYGTLLSTVGGGALVAALTVAKFGTEFNRRRFLLGGAGLVALGLAGVARSSALSGAVTWCGVFGFGMILFFATGQATVQLTVADSRRAAVLSVWAMVLAGSTPVGNLLLGPAADWWGEQAVLTAQALAAGTVAFTLAVVFWRQAGHSDTVRVSQFRGNPASPASRPEGASLPGDGAARGW